VYKDDDAEQAYDEPHAFASDQTYNLIPGVTDKPVKLNIVAASLLRKALKYHTVEKFNIVERAAAPAKGKEANKGPDDQEKISMGKGYFSLEEATITGSKVFYHYYQKPYRQDPLKGHSISRPL